MIVKLVLSLNTQELSLGHRQRRSLSIYCSYLGRDLIHCKIIWSLNTVKYFLQGLFYIADFLRKLTLQWILFTQPLAVKLALQFSEVSYQLSKTRICYTHCSRGYRYLANIIFCQVFYKVIIIVGLNPETGLLIFKVHSLGDYDLTLCRKIHYLVSWTELLQLVFRYNKRIGYPDKLIIYKLYCSDSFKVLFIEGIIQKYFSELIKEFNIHHFICSF